MKKIAVLHNRYLYAWVDTVVMTDEIESTLAVLVSPTSGEVFMRDIKTIKVIDKDIVD